MARRLSDEALRCLSRFDDVTDAEAIDCIIDEQFERVVFVVRSGQLADAVGPQGRTVERLEEVLNREVALVADADRPEDFVANALRPAAVYDVEIEDGEQRVAWVEVPPADTGAAIGVDGHRIDLARRLAARHFDIDDVRLVDEDSE